FYFYTTPPTPQLHPLSLHDALPISITSASSGSASHPPIADQATPKSELRKLPTSAGALPWVRSDFPRPVGRPPRSLLCNACYLYQRCLASFTELLRALTRLY